MTTPEDPFATGPTQPYGQAPPTYGQGPQGYGQQPYGGQQYGYGYGPLPQTGTDGFSVAALVLGIFPILGGVLGIVFGILGIRRTGRGRRSGRGMAVAGVVLGSLWVIGILSVVIVGGFSSGGHRDATGRLTSTGTVDLADLRVGDCVAGLPTGRTTTLDVQPCDQAHVGEVYSSSSLPAGPYPGDTEVRRLANGGCRKALEGYVGGQDAADRYEITFIRPTSASWAQDDRLLTCIVHLPDRAPLTGPVPKGASDTSTGTPS